MPKESPEALATLRAEVRTLTAEWRDSGRYVPRTDCWLRSFDLGFSEALAEHGLIGLTWPKRFGGAERSAVARLVVTEELLRAGAPVAAHWIADRQIGPAILRHGTEQLQQEILPGIVAAKLVFCLGMSEPQAGSDLAAVTTTATKVDGGWRITGRKTWTSNAHLATHAYVLARTSAKGRKHEGLSEFVLDMTQPGVTVSPIRDLAGEHHFNELSLDGVFVPDHYLIGEVGRGWRQVVDQLSFERGGPERVLTTYPLLVAAIERCRSDPGDRVRAELGALVARLATLRSLCVRIAEAVDAGTPSVTAAATLKLLGNAFEVDVIEFARRTGAVDDPLFDASLLASPGFSIRGGASDVLLSIISREVSS